jgi:8-amino-7-oxononanoate synthase
MFNRRNFLSGMAAGLVGIKWGVRGFFDQVRYVMQGAPGAETVINGKRYLYFGGTGYYGLINNPAMLKAADEALEKYGMHSSTSRGTTGYGNTPLYAEVEKKTAEYYGVEDSFYIPSGYLANVAGYQALDSVYKIDAVFVDEDSHYSVIDFTPVIGKPVYTFAHRDPEDLKKKLQQHLKPGQKPLVASDGVFPLFGGLAPLPAYLEVTEPYGGYIWLDDAHSVGVLGPHGRGTADHFGVKSDRIFFGGTFSKAFGSHGAHIPGNGKFIQTVRDGHVAHGATSSPSPAAAAAIVSMDLLRNHPEMKAQLWKNTKMMKSGLHRLGFNFEDSPHPITAWVLKSGEEMDRIQQELFNRGIAIQALNYAGGGALGALRVVVFSTHTPEQINRLLDELKKIV